MNRRGQSILEYSILFVAIVGVILVMVTTVFKPKVADVYNKSADILDTGIGMMNGIAGQ